MTKHEQEKRNAIYKAVISNARLCIALDMCNDNDLLLEQAISTEVPEMFQPFGEDRVLQIQILRELLRLEPTMQKILKIYAEV